MSVPTPGPHDCDGGDFDRTVCPEPCNEMHSYCTVCGSRAERCAADLVSVPVSPTPEPRRLVECDLGIDCAEAGRCYAVSNGRPDMCPTAEHGGVVFGSWTTDKGSRFLTAAASSSSPTPDEQAAETRRTCQACGAPTYAHASDCRAVLLAQGSEMAEVVDLRAALVVVREQLTRVEARNAALVSALERTRDNFVAAVRGTPVRDMAETLAEVDAALPCPPTYTTEDGQDA